MYVLTILYPPIYLSINLINQSAGWLAVPILSPWRWKYSEWPISHIVNQNKQHTMNNLGDNLLIEDI